MSGPSISLLGLLFALFLSLWSHGVALAEESELPFQKDEPISLTPEDAENALAVNILVTLDFLIMKQASYIRHEEDLGRLTWDGESCITRRALTVEDFQAEKIPFLGCPNLGDLRDIYVDLASDLQCWRLTKQAARAADTMNPSPDCVKPKLRLKPISFWHEMMTSRANFVQLRDELLRLIKAGVRDTQDWIDKINKVLGEASRT